MRRHLSSACFAIGTLWVAAGVLKMVFGAQVMLPLVPPFGLDRVSIVPSLFTGLLWFGFGAVIGRGAPRDDAERSLSDAPSASLPHAHITAPHMVPQARQAEPVRVTRE